VGIFGKRLASLIALVYCDGEVGNQDEEDLPWSSSVICLSDSPR
jgi:hypothetical protein